MRLAVAKPEAFKATSFHSLLSRIEAQSPIRIGELSIS
jgi:hypothetical protein